MNRIVISAFCLAAAVRADPQWPTWQYDNRRTGKCPYTGPEVPVVSWTYEPEGGIVWSSPVVGEDGTVYFGCKDDNLYAINPDGTLKWKYKTEGDVASSPAIGPDGTIYFASDDSYLYAIEDSGKFGKLKWKYRVVNPQYRPRGPLMVESDGTIYVPSSHLEAVDKDGNRKWTFNTGVAGLPHGASISADASSLFIEHATAMEYGLACLGKEGVLKWEVDLGGAPFDFSHSVPTTGSGGVVYYPTGFDNSKLFAVTASGEVQWSLSGLGDMQFTSAALGANGTIFITGGGEGDLHALRPDSHRLWTVSIPGPIFSSPIVAGNSTVYVASSDTLYAVSADGTIKWTLEAEPEITATPAISAEGVLYFCSAERLYAITTEGGGGTRFNRGDVNADGSLNIADAVALLGSLFGGQPPPVCPDAADANDDGVLNIADPIAVLAHLFGGGGALPEPFGRCGADQTEDRLDCPSFPPCASEGP